MRTRLVAVLASCFCLGDLSRAQTQRTTHPAGPASAFSVLVGRPTDRSITISVMVESSIEAFIEYGTTAGSYPHKSPVRIVESNKPFELELAGLQSGTRYFYRVRGKTAGATQSGVRGEGSFRTQPGSGETVVFCVQGDSHPERQGRMYDSELYTRALNNVAADHPDFHFLMGDDFSIERLIERGPPQGEQTQQAVDSIYAGQRSFLAIVGQSTPLMLVNGNHEQAAKYLLDGTPNNYAVFAGRARTAFFPLPAPDKFYTGNTHPVDHIGLLRDYYAWLWGDSLFIVIDPYWHSPVPVDNEAGVKARNRDSGGGGGKGKRDLWQITLGDEQYQWLRETLSHSTAKFKFVFSHHVSGTGRGGVEVATYYEWGGHDRRAGGGKVGRGKDRRDDDHQADKPASSVNARGLERFFQARPTWEKPIHDLLRDTGVTIFFQGHDHLYARQELDGVTYQTCPNPADPTFTAFNREAYQSGDIFSNSGHLRITVTGGADAECKVEYVRAARPGDEAQHGPNGSIIHQYSLRPRPPGTTVNPKKEGSPR